MRSTHTYSYPPHPQEPPLDAAHVDRPQFCSDVQEDGVGLAERILPDSTGLLSSGAVYSGSASAMLSPAAMILVPNTAPNTSPIARTASARVSIEIFI
jgi:hypothetical protein